jgi:integrase
MRERKLQIVEKRGKIYARTTYVGLDGKRHAIWRAGKNKTEAKQNLQKVLDKLRDDEGAITHAKKTFAELAAWYEDRYLIPPVYRDGRIIRGKRSYSSEKYLLKGIVAHLGGYKLRSITHGELEKYKDARLHAPTQTKRPRTIASVNRELMVIRAMLRKAQKEGWLLRTPFEEHDPLIRMADERRREQTLSYDEETRLLTACEGPRHHLKPILICALSTGMRLGEILKLEWPGVNFVAREIKIISTNTKSLAERSVPITPPLMEELLRLHALRPDDGSVFGTSNNVRRSFKTACNMAGIKHGGIDGLTFHCLRHTAGTRMVKQGMELAEVARILGHSDIKTTYRYISADSDVMNKARAALAFRPPPISQTSD